MLLGVLGDTHGHLPFTREAVRVLETFDVSAVLHCGDIGSAEVVALFAAWPTHFVLGNVDDAVPGLPAAIAAAGQTCHGQFAELELAGRRIALLHGHDTRRLREAIECGAWDMVCHGHTHLRDLRRVGATLVLNPGAIYRANPRSLAIVDTASLEVTSVPL